MNKKSIILNFLRENHLLTTVTLGCGLLANLLTILLPVSLGRYFELLFGVGSRRATVLGWFPKGLAENVPTYLSIFFGMVLLRTLLHYIQRRFGGVLGERFAKQVRERLFDHQMRISTKVYDEKGTGKFLLRYAGDMQSLQNYLTVGILQFTIDGLLLVLVLCWMLWLSPFVFLTMAVGLVLIGIIVFILNRELNKATNLRRGGRSSLLAFVNERLLALVTLKAFNKEVPEFQKFVKQSDQLFNLGASFQHVYGLIYAIVPGLIYGLLGLVLWVTYRLTSNNSAQLDGGSLLAFVLLFITVLPVMRRLYRANSTWEMGNVSFQKLLNVLQLDAEAQNLPEFKFIKGKLELKELNFGFSKKKRLFSKLTATIRPRQITVLTAPTSFGKTTLVRLLLGIYRPTQGQILIDEQSTTTVDLKSLRKHVVAVSDGLPLLGKTVFEAISYSRKPEKRNKAALLLEELQQGLPMAHQLQLDTKIGERGIRLSAGQRRLLQYARAFLTNKPILIVDEPLADLPIESRINIASHLARGKTARTTLLLASEWSDDWLQADVVVDLSKPGTYQNSQNNTSGE